MQHIITSFSHVRIKAEISKNEGEIRTSGCIFIVLLN